MEIRWQNGTRAIYSRVLMMIRKGCIRKLREYKKRTSYRATIENRNRAHFSRHKSFLYSFFVGPFRFTCIVIYVWKEEESQMREKVGKKASALGNTKSDSSVPLVYLQMWTYIHQYLSCIYSINSTRNIQLWNRFAYVLLIQNS